MDSNTFSICFRALFFFSLGVLVQHFYIYRFTSFLTVHPFKFPFNNSLQANTGIVVDDGAIDEFCSFKIKKGTRYGFITYKIDKENGKIVTDQKSESRTVQDLINALPEDDCRFAILDNDYKTHDGRDSSKLVMIAW